LHIKLPALLKAISAVFLFAIYATADAQGWHTPNQIEQFEQKDIQIWESGQWSHEIIDKN